MLDFFYGLSDQEIISIIGNLSEDQKGKLSKLILDNKKIWNPQVGPQKLAYFSDAAIVGYGGAAGGGKTDLICGLALTKHKRSLILRKEKKDTRAIIDRMESIIGTSLKISSQKPYSKYQGRYLEFGGLVDPTSHERYQGNPHDLRAFDEATQIPEFQVRYCLGWVRTTDPTIKTKAILTFNPPTDAKGKWVLDFFAPWIDRAHKRPAKSGEPRFISTINGQDVEVETGEKFIMHGDEIVYDFDPAEHAAADIITPQKRTFIHAKLTDNEYLMATSYMTTLQSLPEPLRSKLLYGDFYAGVEDDEYQLIKTEWVEAAFNRWTQLDPMPEMIALGVDPARGGNDRAIIFPRYENFYFGKYKAYKGVDINDGFKLAGRVVENIRDNAVVNIEVNGIGASPADFLKRESSVQVNVIDVTGKAVGAHPSGLLKYKNRRAEMWWNFAQLLDPAAKTGIAIPPCKDTLRELCAMRWSYDNGTVVLTPREQLVAELGRSPDIATALVLAALPVHKRKEASSLQKQAEIKNRYSHLKGDW